MDDAGLARRMEMEFEQEIDLADLKDNARRGDTKRKAEVPEKTRKSKKRKLEKLVNWGMEVEEEGGEVVEEPSGVTDWVFRKETDPTIKDWLLQPTEDE